MLPKYPYSAIRAVLILLCGVTCTNQLFANEEDTIYLLPTVSITGSRLDGPTVSASVPVTVIETEEIELLSAKTVSELLRKQAFVFGRENYRGEQSPNPGGGEASIALRGLDATSTLVLLNGRRMAPNSGLTTDGNFVNLNTIPLSAIEAVEVLRDGAGSVYGSDALAGVVNIILKERYEGSRATVTYGNTTSRDAGLVAADFTYGKSTGKTSFLLHTYFWERNGIDSPDRELTKTADYKRFGGIDHRSVSSPEGLYFILSPFVYVYGDPGSAGNPASNIPPGYSNASGPLPMYDFKEMGNELMPQNRYGALFNVNHKFSSDTSVYVRVLANRLESESTLAPAPFALSIARLGIPGEPLTPLFIPANHIHNPFGADMNSDMAELAKRMSELGPRVRDSEVDTLHFTVGAEGMLTDEWDWATAFTFSTEQTREEFSNILNKAALQQQLLITDPSQPAFNLFGLPEYNLMPSQAAALEAVRLNTRSRKRTSVYQWDASAKGPLGNFGDKPIESVFGVEARREETNLRPDANITAFNSIGATNQTAFSDYRHIFSIFGEAAFPIIGSPDETTGQKLTLILSSRYEYYDDFGSTFNPGLRINYVPVKAVSFRAGVQRGFRAPSLESLHQGYAESYNYFSSPWTNPSYPVRVGRTSNPDLDPEESLSWSAGVTWKPFENHDFSLFADFFAIKVTDKIQVPDPATYLNEFAGQLNAGEEGNGIRFNPSTSFVGEVEIPYRNFGEQTARMVELGASWFREVDGVGELGIKIMHTYILHYSEIVRPGGARIESAGDFNTLIDQSISRNRSTASLSWEGDRMGVTASMSWIEGVDEQRGPVRAKTDNWFSMDVSASYAITKATSIRVSVENVFDEQPPFSYGAGALAYDQRTYPIMGRNYAISLTHEF